MINQIYQLLKTDPAYSWMSDKEKFIYLQLSEITGDNKTDAELCQICGQRASMLNKFVAELREKKLYPVPVTVLPKMVPPDPPPRYDKVFFDGMKAVERIANPPIPTGPICEVCGLEGKVAADRGRPVMHGIELFREDGRIVCATCRTKLINPKHGTFEQRPVDEEEDDDEII